MGSNNSSKTRVVPVFDALLKLDASGTSWLDSVLSLVTGGAVVEPIAKGQRLASPGKRRWGEDEISISSPASLLEFLVQNIDLDQVTSSSDKGDTLAKRTALANRDPATIIEAIQALRDGKRGRKWFVLEGESRPDAFFEMEDVVVCVEGKRTEARCTNHTTWMRCRSQLIRHMDAAFDAYPRKRVVGLLIVEGKGGAEAVAPSQHWLDQCSAQYAPAMLVGSLPHRSIEERTRIAEGVFGVTTWQAICAKFNLNWPPA